MFSPRRCLLPLALCVATALPGLLVQVSAQASSAGPRQHARSSLAAVGAVPRAVRARGARRLGTLSSARALGITLALTPRRFGELSRRVASGRYVHNPLTPSAFRARYSPTRDQLRLVLAWGRQHGLRTQYVAADRLMVTFRGSVAAVEGATGTSIDRFTLSGRSFYSNVQPATLPRSLKVAAVVGLDNAHRFVHLIQRATVRSGGFHPADLRAAYNVDGSQPDSHTGSGEGQVIGLTDFGGNALSNADLSHFASLSGDPAIKTCKVSTTGDKSTPPPTPPSCQGSSAADTIQWVYVDGKNRDTGNEAQEETALDVEYAHGMAPSVHLKYFLANDTGADGTDVTLADALSQAENDPSLNIISNSWGVPIGGSKDSFVKATQIIFLAADSRGKTFYFATGDGAADSGCFSGNPFCMKPSYPAGSPYVAAVGGTHLSLSPDLSTYDKESVWNFIQTIQGGQPAISGGGGGCASYFARPAWQKGIPSLTANATCSGRAIPDVSADADPYSGVRIYVGGRSIEVGGTSLAAPLWAGMAADSDNYLAANQTDLTGWIVPKLYSLAEGPYYDNYFHDVTCGFNGYPAAPFWDEASGWGTPDWYQLTLALANGSSGSPAGPSTLCSPVTSADALGLPFDQWPAQFIPGSGIGPESRSESWLDNADTNPFRQFHTQTYASRAVQGAETADGKLKIGTDSSPVASYVATFYANNAGPVALVKDVLTTLSRRGLAAADCSAGLVMSGDAPPDCHLITLPVRDWTGAIHEYLCGFYAVGNVLLEVRLDIHSSTFGNGKDRTLAVHDFRGISKSLVQLTLAGSNGFQPTN